MDLRGPAQEFRFALLERDGVDHRLTLRHFKSRLKYLPFRRVDHHRHAGDLRLRGHQVEERAHRRRTVDQPVVHADVDDLRPGVDLCAGHRERLFVVGFADQPCETGRSGDVRAFADVDEVGFGDDPQRLQTAQGRDVFRRGNGPRGVVSGYFRQFEYVGGRRAAAAAHDVHQSATHILADIPGEHFGRLVVTAHHVGKPCVRVRRDARSGHCRQPFEVGQQLLGPVGAIQSDRQQVRMRHRDGEGLDGLPREGAAAGVGERSGDHHGDRAAQPLAERVDGPEGRLGVERVENGLHQQDVRPAVHQSPHLIRICFDQLCEGHLAGRGILYVGRHRGRAVRGTHRSRHETRLLRVAGRELVGRAACDSGCGLRNLVSALFEPVVGQRHGVGVERVGFDDVGSRPQVFFVNLEHHVRAGQREQVVAALELHRPAGEPPAAVVLLLQSVALHHRAEASVEQQDAALQLVV